MAESRDVETPDSRALSSGESVGSGTFFVFVPLLERRKRHDETLERRDFGMQDRRPIDAGEAGAERREETLEAGEEEGGGGWKPTVEMRKTRWSSRQGLA